MISGKPLLSGGLPARIRGICRVRTPGPGKDIELKPPEYYERMRRAYDQEATARHNYFEKLAALQKCRQAHDA